MYPLRPSFDFIIPVQSGASDFITYILDMVAGNLALLSQDYDKQYKEGFKVHMVLNAQLDEPSCI